MFVPRRAKYNLAHNDTASSASLGDLTENMINACVESLTTQGGSTREEHNRAHE